tara:strand:+ start:21 stop:218 length:198 start_codon:yes stop_codon:yes gene_type:complete
MIYFVIILLNFLINKNLSIIDKKISFTKERIKTHNLTNEELEILQDELRVLKLHRYGIIIREDLK